MIDRSMKTQWSCSHSSFNSVTNCVMIDRCLSVMIDRCQCADWQVYEDFVELQSFFIQQRDELCDDWQVSVWWLTGLWRLCRVTVVLHSTAWRAVWWLTGVSVMIDRSMKTLWTCSRSSFNSVMSCVMIDRYLCVMIDRCQCDDWQVYEDSVELQSFFIQQRDELCRRGEVLLTPALNFTAQQFTETIEDERREQTSREQQQDEDECKKHTLAAAAAAVKLTSAQVRLKWCTFLGFNSTLRLLYRDDKPQLQIWQERRIK